MKKIIFLPVFFLCAIHTSLFAQQETQKRKTAEQRTEMVTKKMTDELGLSKEQQTQVYDLVLKREKLRDAGRLPKDSREQIVSDINKTLSSDQQKQWAEMRKEAKAKHEQLAKQKKDQEQGKQKDTEELQVD